MRKLKEQGYKDMHPFILDLESRDHGPLAHCSAGNRLGVSRKFDETDNLAKHAEVCDDSMDPWLPELVAFLQETSASGKRHPSHGKCEVQGCEVDHDANPCIIDSDADSGSEVAGHALWTETSTSCVLKFRAKQVLHEDRAEIKSPEQVATEKKADVDAKDEIPVEHISPEMLPIHRHIPGEASATPISSASDVAAATERQPDKIESFAREQIALRMEQQPGKDGESQPDKIAGAAEQAVVDTFRLLQREVPKWIRFQR